MISAHAVDRSTTLASAIRIAEPAHIAEVEALVADGTVEPVAVTDEDITRMWLELAQSEGIFCEPSSAAGVAAVEKLPLERGSTVVCVLTGHGLKDAARVGRLHPGCGARRPERRVDPRGARARFEQAQPCDGMNFVVKAPATSANLGPGFDCAGAALDLWNELHVLPAEEGEPLVEVEGVGADEITHDETHLALRAFTLLSPLDGHRFRFVNRIPLESGLGSSAATVAAGLVAGRVAGGRAATTCSSSACRSRATPTTSRLRCSAASA